VERLEHLGSGFSDYWVDGVLDARGANDAADLLVNWTVGGHNDGVGSETLQLSYRFASPDDIQGSDSIALGQPDDHASQFRAGRRLKQPFPRRDG
jgi:hypothetical protein